MLGSCYLLCHSFYGHVFQVGDGYVAYDTVGAAAMVWHSNFAFPQLLPVSLALAGPNDWTASYVSVLRLQGGDTCAISAGTTRTSFSEQAICDLLGSPFTAPPQSNTCLLVQHNLKVTPLHPAAVQALL